MPPRHCCCAVPNCEISSDTFNRADSNPPSGNWSVEGGEWEINTNELRSISQGPIITTIRQTPSVRVNTKYSIKMYFKITNADTLTEWGVICGYTDVNNFSWVKFTLSGGTTLYPTFYVRSGGVDTELMSPTTHPWGVGFSLAPDYTWEGKICYSDEDWTVDDDPGAPTENGGIENVGSQSAWTLGTQGGQATLPSGLGMVGFLYGDFDDFYYHKHWESLIICDFCSCLCIDPDDYNDYKHIPSRLVATFVPLFDPADYPCSLNYSTIALFQGVPDSGGGAFHDSPTKRQWTSDGPGDHTPSDMQAVFYCDSSNGTIAERYKLCFGIPSMSGSYDWGAGIPVAGYPCAGVTWSESSCYPFSLTFQALTATPTTCEIVPGVGPQGLKNPLCPDGECLEETTANRDFLAGLAWKVILTEAP